MKMEKIERRILVGVSIYLVISFFSVKGYAEANIKVTGANNLNELLSMPNLVTVVIKDSGARDVNLKLIEVQKDYLVFETEREERVTYRNDQIQEIIVQEQKVEKTPIQGISGVILRTEERVTVDRAWARLNEIFNSSDSNQDLKIECASLLIQNGSEEAENYLQKLLDSNEITTQVASARGLYLAGKPIPTVLLRSGIEHGNRRVKAQSAILAGLTNYRDGIPSLQNMLQDRSGEISGPSAQALSQMGVREVIPKLIELLLSPNEQKSEPAIYALVQLGGEDVKEQLKQSIPRVEGMAKYRIAKTLFYLKDPDGRTLLSQLFEEQVTLRPDIALILARVQDWKSIQFLRARLARRENPTDTNLIYRANALTSLYIGGDTTVLPGYQELLREASPAVKKETCRLIFKLGDRNLIKVLPSTIENQNVEVAFEACRAAVGVVLPEYRQRYSRLKGELW